jgi:hypothetical protein
LHIYVYFITHNLLPFYCLWQTYTHIYVYLSIYIQSKGIEYLVPLLTCVAIKEGYNVMVNSEELIGITECLILFTKGRIKQCPYNRV